MACQMTFQRYELKYLLSPQDKEAVLLAMKPYMRLDGYGRTTIRNVYLDTDQYRLIRRSLEKPTYKEKLRIRSYQSARPEDGPELWQQLHPGCDDGDGPFWDGWKYHFPQ